MSRSVYISVAKNTGEGYRKGSVNDRTQNKAPNGNPIKRNSNDGRIMDQKTTEGDYKGVAHEPDGRRKK